jgi:hypothetical protein
MDMSFNQCSLLRVVLFHALVLGRHDCDWSWCLVDIDFRAQCDVKFEVAEKLPSCCKDHRKVGL